MSAFMCSKLHVAAIVRWWHDNGRRTWLSDHDAGDLAAMLHAANARSVNCRYPDGPPAEGEAFTFPEIMAAPKLTPVQCLKAIQCLDYQSCEVDDWRKTPACRFLNDLQGAVIGALPGYAEAAWDLDDLQLCAAPSTAPVQPAPPSERTPDEDARFRQNLSYIERHKRPEEGW